MADNPIEIGEPELTAEDVAKQKLLGRIAVAGVIIVGLLGTLAMFDALYAPKRPAPATVATVTPPAPPAAEPAAEPAPPSAIEPTPASNPEPAVAVPAATPESTTAAPAEPLPPLPAERLTKLANPQKALLAPPATVVPPPAAAKPAPMAAVPSPSAANSSAARTPVHGAPTAPPAPAKAGGPLSALLPPDQAPRHFALQLGVFSNFANAEELRGKLEAAGIPTTVEARVRAGPFATRAEADAARVKLRSLGIEESIMVSVRR